MMDSDPQNASSVPRTSVVAAEPPTAVELTPQSILIEEFRYAADTAKQMSDSRERLFTFYLTIVGGAISAFGAIYQYGLNSHISIAPLASALLLGFGVVSPILFAQMIRLGQGWRDSQIAMNTIKTYYINRVGATFADLESAFYWQLTHVPAGRRARGGTFLRTYPIAIIGSVSLALGATVVAQYAKLSLAAQLIFAVVFLLILVAHTVYYRVAFASRLDWKVRLAHDERVRNESRAV